MKKENVHILFENLKSSFYERTKSFRNKVPKREKLENRIFILPNLLTTANMFCGFLSIIYALQSEFLMASYAIVVASIFDLLDGRVARWTKSVSEFGAQYDSLSDLLSFVLAPALLLFLWALEPFDRLGWLISFFFVTCGALRLARFNTQKNVKKFHFRGLPTPMAGGIVASSVLIFNELEWEAYHSWVVLLSSISLGGLMLSPFCYRNFKDVDLKQRLPFGVLIIGVFIFAMVALYPEIMLFCFFVTYAFLGVVLGPFRKKNLPRKARSIRRNDNEENIENHFNSIK